VIFPEKNKQQLSIKYKQHNTNTFQNVVQIHRKLNGGNGELFGGKQ